MFRSSSLMMRRLLLFLVFAAIGATNPVEDFDEWDFQRPQDTLGIVNGSHSISGAAFKPEPPVVLVKALKTLWTYNPFPEIPQPDPKPLNQILDQALFELNDRDLRMFQHECADTHLFSYWKQLLRDDLAEVFQSHQIFKTDLEIMRQSLIVFLNSSLQDRTFERPNRYKRSLLVPIVGTTLGSELSRVFLRPFTAPVADKFSCFVDKLVPFGSLCKEDERKKIEALARQVKYLEENVFYLKSKLLEAITVRMPADVEKRKLPTLKRSLQENVEMLNDLPDRRITEEMMAALVQPFMQEVEEVHTTIAKKIWRDVILPCGATLITLGLLLLLGWAQKKGKLYAMKKYVERFRCNEEETAAAAALELSNIEAAQEECVLEKQSAKKSAPPRIS